MGRRLTDRLNEIGFDQHAEQEDYNRVKAAVEKSKLTPAPKTASLPRPFLRSKGR